ncbi:hypothetical protein [Pseudaestuariivita atlantica]|uniref:Uncharacterized protein n=1 Tax=Pseudaestuariivita atlantica TaxID=1317121 RepID=A0A0L1JQH2_9RHOB|nr:hypothetical protein [Pseudaestuariivita atlantica]KNG93957.1 hypothetical protein ATO11_06720 [Pseudaestuariivita atlantica]
MRGWAPFAVLVVATGVMAFVAGWQARGVTETDVIERYTARYVADGGSATDCIAVPGEGRVWIEVRCGAIVYHASRFGRLLKVERPGGPEA